MNGNAQHTQWREEPSQCQIDSHHVETPKLEDTHYLATQKRLEESSHETSDGSNASTGSGEVAGSTGELSGRAGDSGAGRRDHRGGRAGAIVVDRGRHGRRRVGHTRRARGAGRGADPVSNSKKRNDCE